MDMYQWWWVENGAGIADLSMWIIHVLRSPNIDAEAADKTKSKIERMIKMMPVNAPMILLTDLNWYEI